MNNTTFQSFTTPENLNRLAAAEQVDQQAERTARMFVDIAGEPVRVLRVRNTMYGFCTSELGALRLFHKYNIVVRNPRTRAEYSQTAECWFFAIDLE